MMEKAIMRTTEMIPKNIEQSKEMKRISCD